MTVARHSFVTTLFGAVVAVALTAFAVPEARATTLTLSQFSSETDPGPGVLTATLSFVVTGSELTLTLSNGTTAPDTYSINGVWWNATPNVTALSLISATHSKSGDVMAAWNPVETASHVAGFGTFDFGLTVPSNMKKSNILEAGENIVFVLSIAGTGPFTAADFVELNANGNTGAAKFVSGPGDLSAFGATNDTGGIPAPEPGTAALLGAGLLGMALAGRRRS
jgi:hypothetical protein